jgi:uncharacterized protein (TIGR02996 family)
MSAFEGLLTAIRDEPDADEPRLILADWLEDHGEPLQAELIHVQCALARLPAFHEFRPDLEARERGLLQLLDAPYPVQFRRGIRECAQVNAEALLTDPDRHLRSGLIRDLSIIVGSQSEIRSVAGVPQLRFVRRLVLNAERLTDWIVATLLRSPHLQQLDSLRICCRRFTRRALSRILELLPTLRELDLRYCQLSTNDLLGLLPREPCSLESLSLDYNRVGDEGVVALANCPHLAHLRELSLLSVGMTTSGLHALLQAPFAPCLETLSVGGNEEITGPPLALLGQAFPVLRKLYQSSCSFTWDDPPTATPASAPTLRELWVDCSPDRCMSWFNLPALARLEVLSVAGSWPDAMTIPDELVNALASTSFLSSLRQLDLGAALTSEGLKRLLSGANVRRWQSLDLSNGNLGDVGAALLAGCEQLADLRQLRVTDDALGDPAVASLVRSPYLKRLTVLDLQRNKITDTTPFAGTYLANPAILELDDNPLLRGQEELARSGLDALRRVDIQPILAQLATEGRS